MEQADTLAGYKGKWGMALPYKGDENSVCDNGVLYSAQAMLLGLMTGDAFRNILDRVSAPGGLIHRYPRCDSLDGPDNLIGALMIGPDFAFWALMYGLSTKPRWVYNQEDPGKFNLRSWLGRMPGLIGLIKWMDHSGGNFFERLCWNVGVFITMRDTSVDQQGRLNTSDRMLCETTFLSPHAREWTYEWLRKRWRLQIDRDFGDSQLSGGDRNGLEVMVSYYFPEGHPFRKVWGC